MLNHYSLINNGRRLKHKTFFNKMKRLLILDINGLLCCKIKSNAWYDVVIRPGVTTFLSHCYNHYRVAFFSSTTQQNAEPILVHLLTRKQIMNTEFVWYRDRTHRDDRDPTGIKTIKKLSDVFDNPVINQHNAYHPGNTLIVDDEASKMIFNDPRNVLIVPTFMGAADDTDLTRLHLAIHDKFTQLIGL